MSMPNEHDTIIIGGGIAGLACAHRLNEAGKDFLLITKDIGGRIISSADGKFNYGAVWIGSNYRHVSRYVKKGSVVKRNVYDYSSGEGKSLSVAIFRHPLEFLRSLFLVSRFKRAYVAIQKRSESVPQKQAIEEDPYLKKLYHQRADEFVAEHGIEHFARDFIEPILYSVWVSRIKEQTAFNFLLSGLAMIIRVYSFSFNKEEFIAPFKDRIMMDEVLNISKNEDGYLVSTVSGNNFLARNLVMATPSGVAQKLIGLPEIKKGKDVYVSHIKGEISKRYKKGYMKFFGYEQDVFAILDEAHGNYIAYSFSQHSDFGKFFRKWQIVDSVGWHPMYNCIGDTLLDARQGHRLWLAGDHNIVGMEDAFITGLFAANEIIKK